MRYFKETYKYFFDKGPYLILLSIVPSLLLPFLISPSGALYYLLSYDVLDDETFGEMFLQMQSIPYSYYWLGVIGFVLFVFVFALLFGIVDRHMRIGEFIVSFRRAKTRLNYNLLTSLKFSLFTGLIYEITNIVTTALFYLWWVVFGEGVTWLVFSLISMLLASLVMLMIMSAVILWAPFMLHTGLSTAEAFKMGWRQMGGKTFSAAFTLFVAVVPFQLAMALTGIFDCGMIVRMILDGLSYAVVLPLYVVLMYVLFYSVTGTERMDLQKTDIWSKKLPK